MYSVYFSASGCCYSWLNAKFEYTITHGEYRKRRVLLIRKFPRLKNIR